MLSNNLVQRMPGARQLFPRERWQSWSLYLKERSEYMDRNWSTTTSSRAKKKNQNKKHLRVCLVVFVFSIERAEVCVCEISKFWGRRYFVWVRCTATAKNCTFSFQMYTLCVRLFLLRNGRAGGAQYSFSLYCRTVNSRFWMSMW